MSYRIKVLSNQKSCPIIVCDWCKSSINDGNGNALWLQKINEDSGHQEYSIFHTHKNCNHSFELNNPPPNEFHWMAVELNHHIFMMQKNSGYNHSKGKRIYSMMDEIGV